jgi:hypothetical protein
VQVPQPQQQSRPPPPRPAPAPKPAVTKTAPPLVTTPSVDPELLEDLLATGLSVAEVYGQLGLELPPQHAHAAPAPAAARSVSQPSKSGKPARKGKR